MLVLSHRGYHVAVPENTYDAFESALRLGVDGIETDLQLSADGHLILFHDRLTPDGRATASLSRSDLGAVVGYPIPTLEEVLHQYKDVLWNIEIKTPAVLEQAVALLRPWCYTRRLLITSFWHPVIEHISQRLDVDCGIVVAHRPFARALPLARQPAERLLAEPLVRHQLGVARGDREIGLGEHHVHVGQHAAEEWPLAVHPL